MSKIAIFGSNLKLASEKNSKGDHLFFDPSYMSEYKQCYDELAKKSIEKYLQLPQEYQPTAEEQVLQTLLPTDLQPPKECHEKRQMHLRG